MTIKQTVLSTISESGSATWSEIVTAIADDYQIEDWLIEVRGPLQELINEDLIRRTPSVHVEIYALTVGSV